MWKEELKDGTVVVRIGTCAGTEQAWEHVECVLRARGIEPFMHGSRAYAICVPEDRAEEAVQLLSSDPDRERYRFFIYDDWEAL